MLIYLVRHGETQWNKQGRIQGHADIPLNEYGRKLAAITAEALGKVPFEAAFSSPLVRAKETAETLIGDRKIPLTLDARMMEIGFGDREGDLIDAVRANPADPVYDFLEHPDRYCPPGTAESFQDVYRRSRDFLEERIIPLEGQYQTILLTAHGAWNRSVMNPLAGIPIERFWEIEMPNCAVSIIKLENGIFTPVEKSRVFWQEEVL